MRFVAIFTAVLLVTQSLIAQQYYFTAKKNDTFSIAIVDLVNDASTQFSNYRGTASKNSFGDDQYLLNKPIPGTSFGNIKVFFNDATCYLYVVNLGSEAAAKAALDEMVTKFETAFGRNIKLTGKGRSAFLGDYAASLRLEDDLGYFMSNINISQGWGIIEYKAFDDNKKEVRTVHSYPTNYYICITIKGGVPIYNYSIAPNLPVVNAPLCGMISKLLTESASQFLNVRMNKRAHKIYSNTWEYDCTLSLPGWTMLITEGSIGSEIVMTRKVSDLEYAARQLRTLTEVTQGKNIFDSLPGAVPATPAIRVLNGLMAELKPCMGAKYNYTLLKNVSATSASYSVQPVEWDAKAPSMIVSFFESFRKERSVSISIRPR